MSVVYDEVYISTMREINVCKKEIKRLSKSLAGMERKYNLSNAEVIERFNGDSMREKGDYAEWNACYAGLKKWEERLNEFQEILVNER